MSELEGFRDDNDAETSPGSTQSSDDDAGGCWGSADDALANFAASPSYIGQSGSDNGWGHPGDALAHFLDPEEGPLDASDNTGDIPGSIPQG
jgi:hypothetical protein